MSNIAASAANHAKPLLPETPVLLQLRGFHEKEELFARISPIDLERCAGLNWRADPRKHTTYAKADVYAVRPSGVRFRTTVFLHRFIAEPLPEMETHHKDGDGLNCTRSNLENCFHPYNMQQRKPYGSVDFYGVTFERGKYRASITLKAQNKNGRTSYIGRYATAEEAARAYDAKARELYGRFARCNFSLEE